MRIELKCDARRPRAWIQAAVGLGAPDADVFVSWIDTGRPKPAGLDGLFDLERMILRRGRPSGADPLDPRAVAQRPPISDSPDVVIDFTEIPRPASCGARLYLRPLYNGQAGETAALTAALAGDMPVVDIRDEHDGRSLDRGHPSAEIAAGLSGCLDSIMARTMTLLAAVLSGRPRLPSGIASSRTRAESGAIYSYVGSGLARAVVKRIYHLCCYAPHWHVGWRFVDDDGVWASGDLSGPAWQRIPDSGRRFYADPFPITWKGRTFVFFEDLDHRVGKGTISAIEFDARGPTGDVIPVLEEPWHLSYPFLIEDCGELWMIPESSLSNEVSLYRCVEFPTRWERHATLIAGVEIADATVTRHDGRYYLFGVSRDGGGYSDTLSIYHAAQLMGPWHPHASNPVLIDRAAARPAGNFVRRYGRLWRPVQDCADGYGAALGLAEVIDLSPTAFKQAVRHTIRPGPAWPGRKLHTLNRSGRLEVIDGSRIQPKIASFPFK